MKRGPEVTKLKSYFNSCFVTFSFGLFSKTRSTAISKVSYKVIVVKRLQASYEIKKTIITAYLLYFFTKNKGIFSTMLFWDN